MHACGVDYPLPVEFSVYLTKHGLLVPGNGLEQVPPDCPLLSLALCEWDCQFFTPSPKHASLQQLFWGSAAPYVVDEGAEAWGIAKYPHLTSEEQSCSPRGRL